ncbi:MAG TPA: ferritin-like domain-containing protein [Kribbella sp.]|nr:ferritin-like domain-containing protein [Kribbella sp.]
MTEKEALQAALAGEHAAMYGVGVAGGRLKGARFSAATTVYEDHRKRRDRLAAFLVEAGEEPVAAEAAYDLPQPVTSTTAATALVLLIQRRLTSIYGELVEAAEQRSVRTFAIQSLIAMSHTQLNWGATPAAFPGDA